FLRTPTANWIEGNAVSAGDVNVDGFGDLVVGHPGSDRACLFAGCDTGLNAIPVWTANSGQPNSMYGFSVASAGDVNKDGYGDVIIGAHNFNNGQTNAGSAYLYYGSASGLSDTAVWTSGSDQENANYGRSVANAGDINADGFDDAIIGAPNFSNGENNEGRAFEYHGRPTSETILPVHLLAFDVKLTNNINQLHWLTTNEVNTCCFAMERSSDGRIFTEIARIKAKDNKIAVSEYLFNDPYTFTDKIYYRLKMIDADGKFASSSIAELRQSKAGYWQINPNLVVPGQSITIGIQNPENKKNVTLQIIDINGKTVLAMQLAVEKGYQKFPITINISKGTYMVRLTGLIG
ncbi:MAG: T9SS type A sorting domain-containing protein, partial [Chitinophagaceae bacterium]